MSDLLIAYVWWGLLLGGSIVFTVFAVAVWLHLTDRLDDRPLLSCWEAQDARSPRSKDRYGHHHSGRPGRGERAA